MYHSSNSSNNSSRSILTVKYKRLVYFDIIYKNNMLAIRVEKRTQDGWRIREKLPFVQRHIL